MALGFNHGGINRRLRSWRWERLARGVYGIAGAPATPRRALLATCLSVPGAVASHRSAAALWRMPGYPDGVIEVALPRNRRQPRGAQRSFANMLSPREITTIDAVPTTTAARTLLDLAAVDPPGRVEEALDDALRRGLTTIHRLRRGLAAWSAGRLAGVQLLRAMMNARDPEAAIPQSVLETRLLRVLTGAGLGGAHRQYPVRESGRLVAVVDFAFPEVRLAVEADGYRWHSGRARWEADRRRSTRLAALGWRMVHVTWRDLAERPNAVTAEIAACLARGN